MIEVVSPTAWHSLGVGVIHTNSALAKGCSGVQRIRSVRGEVQVASPRESGNCCVGRTLDIDAELENVLPSLS